MFAFLSRQLVRTSAGVVLLAGVGGVPAWLTVAVGWPMPDHLPTGEELAKGLIGPVTDHMVVDLLAVAAWLLWAAFLHAVATEAIAAARGVRAARRGRVNPLRPVAAALITALVLGAVPAAAAGASPTTAQAAPATNVDLGGAIQASERAGHATFHVGDTRYIYVVKRGDYLSKIAKAWLGDADRWPEICALNRHRHFPKVGGTLRECNLIYPGWDLKLPPDAHPPAGAQPKTPPPTATPKQRRPPPAPSPPEEAVATPCSTENAPQGTADPAPPSATASTAPTVSTSAIAAPTTQPSSADPAPAVGNDDDRGVSLPDGGWVPWALAAAVSAAAAMVWLQRRRRYTADMEGDLPTELPAPVTELRRAVLRNPDLRMPTGESEQAAEVPALRPLPPGGIGLIGDGGHAAARAALISVLSSGGPHRPDARGEVVVDAAALTTLIGSDAVALGPWPRLHIADDLDHALTMVEGHLLHRSRILDEHTVTDLDTLRAQAPDEEALPPILLVCETPPPGMRMRAKTCLALGSGLHISALLIGEWNHGVTVDVAADGTTRLVAGHAAAPVPPRLAVLEPDTTVQILLTLREAHTGEPPAISTPTLLVKPMPLVTHQADRPAQSDSDQTSPPSADTGLRRSQSEGPNTPRKARLRVLGAPGIEDVTEPGRPLRAKALELAVFLACHPDGVATREIGEYLEPDARVSQADQRVHTNASNLRHVLARAAGPRKSAYVIKTAGRYRLDPATVDVDLWRLRDLLRSATIAMGELRRQLLQAACDLYTSPLADDQDYEWLQPHREAVRRWGTEAHLLLADVVLNDDPQAASDLLDKAIRLDRYNEQLYRQAMRARHALGDVEGIRILVRALTKALADLDVEPQEETVALAGRLRASLDRG